MVKWCRQCSELLLCSGSAEHSSVKLILRTASLIFGKLTITVTEQNHVLQLFGTGRKMWPYYREEDFCTCVINYLLLSACKDLGMQKVNKWLIEFLVFSDLKSSESLFVSWYWGQNSLGFHLFILPVSAVVFLLKKWICANIVFVRYNELLNKSAIAFK